MSWKTEKNKAPEHDSPRGNLETQPEYQAMLKGRDPTIVLPRNHLSYSQVNLYRICARRYYHKYIKGHTPPQSSNMVHGRKMHEVVESMLKYKIKYKKVPPAEMHKDLITDAVKAATAEIEVWEDKIPDAKVFASSSHALVDIYYKERMPSVRPRAIEQQVVGLIGGRVPFLGYVDMIEMSPMAVISPTDADPTRARRGDTIIDLKFSGRKYPKNQVYNALQLTVYADLLDVDHVGYDLLVETKTQNRSFTAQRAPRSIAEKKHGREAIIDVAEAISAGFFPRTDPDSWACSKKWCAFYAECRGPGPTYPT